MQNIHTLIFDLGGVIINLKSEEDWIAEDLLPNFHPEHLHRLRRDNFFQEYETGKISTKDFTDRMKAMANDDKATDETVRQHWNGILLDMPRHRIALLQRLRTKYRLLLLSNTNELHLETIRHRMQAEFGKDVLSENFHTCYYSQEIGLRKPNREIYEWVLKEQRLSAGQCMFFDDKPENLVEPESLGIRTKQVDFNNLSISSVQYLL